ncbi:MAG: nucleoside/nucleotide kinase family protein [Phycisphaera sp.]|nr:nucleoside/nucleotide kinase family protein [Phycisphaera sp.]
MPNELTRSLDDATIDALALELIERSKYDILHRYIVGIAGIPGAGKTTLAHRLYAHIVGRDTELCRVVSMDGFHFTNHRLEMEGLTPYKGAPQTFDAHAYTGFLYALHDATRTFHAPIYDRNTHDPVIGLDKDCTIGPRCRIIITEGNYLLLDQEPWSDLEEILHECWLLETPEETAKKRLIARHIAGGRTQHSAEEHYANVDAQNTRLVESQMREPDLRLRWPM